MKVQKKADMKDKATGIESKLILKQIKILVITKYKLLGDGLKSLLELDEKLCVISRCNDDEYSIEMIEIMKPDIVVFCLEKENNKLLYKVIKQNTKVILLSNVLDYISIKKSMVLGASSYITLNSEFSILHKAIYAILNNDIYMQESLPCIFNNDAYISHNSLLTKRENQILELISLGVDNKEIAELFDISEVTVGSDITNILRKTERTCRNQLVIYGIKQNNLMYN